MSSREEQRRRKHHPGSRIPTVLPLVSAKVSIMSETAAGTSRKCNIGWRSGRDIGVTPRDVRKLLEGRVPLPHPIFLSDAVAHLGSSADPT